jgi:hypothetical protein
MGYNHYVGRLGMKMPETAALLARTWPEWQVRQDVACLTVVSDAGSTSSEEQYTL